MIFGLLDQTMDVVLPVYAPTAYGGQAPSYSTIYGTVPCRIECLTMNEMDMLARRGIQATDKVFCEANLSLLPTYELQLQDQEEGVLRKYIITGQHSPRAMSGIHHLEVIVRHIE